MDLVQAPLLLPADGLPDSTETGVMLRACMRYLLPPPPPPLPPLPAACVAFSGIWVVFSDHDASMLRRSRNDIERIGVIRELDGVTIPHALRFWLVELMLMSDSEPPLTFTFDTYDELMASSLYQMNKFRYFSAGKIAIFSSSKILTIMQRCAFVVAAAMAVIVAAVARILANVGSGVSLLLP